MVFFKRMILALCLLAVYLGTSDSKSQLIQLNENNWQEMLTGQWMVEFYAPWCPACKALQPLWEDFSTWSKDLDFSVGQVDVTTSPGLSGRFMVTALPTIFHIINGEFRQYKGTRDRDAFISFIEDEKWKSIEPIPSWKSPSSIQMSIVSHFFKLSQVLRTIHTKLMDDYGLPNWGSYVIFALVTILLGAVLGLLMVCFIDFVYPPKVKVYYPQEDKIGSAGLEEDDLDKEELVDENTEQENVDNAETAARKRKARKAD